jgi:hypothetical protein
MKLRTRLAAPGDSPAMQSPNGELPMSQAPDAAPAPYRHPLGLPAGSIRAIMSLMILGLFWLLLVVPQQEGKNPIHVPLAVYCLLALVLHFFGSHGHSIPSAAGQPSPLHLPRGSIRFIMVAGSVAIVGYEYWFDAERMLARLTPQADQLTAWPHLLMALGGGFIFGLLLRLGPWKRLPAYQDILAWISLVAILLLAAYTVFHILISPTMNMPIDPLIFECLMVSVVSLYFGARS